MPSRIYYSREAEQRANQEKVMIIILFLLLGLGIGAVLALLFAPKSGAAIRSEITERVEEAIQSVEHEVAELRQRVEESAKE